MNINKEGKILKRYSTINNLNGKKYFIPPVPHTGFYNNKLTFFYLPRKIKQRSNKVILKIIDSLKIEKFNEFEYKKQLDSLYAENYNKYCTITNNSYIENIAKLIDNFGKKYCKNY